MVKILEKSGGTGHIRKHNQNNIQQANSQDQTKGRETVSDRPGRVHQ